MARIGDYIDPSLNRYDPSPYLQAQGAATRSIGAGISGAIDDFKDKLADQREKKNEVKATSKLIESYINLFPDTEGSLAPIRDALKDEELPVSERHALGKNAGSVLAAYLDEKDQAANRDFQRQQIEMEGRRLGIAEAAAGREQTVFDKTLAQAEKSTALSEEIQGLVAPALIEKYIGLARSMEESGQAPPISSATLQNYLQTSDPATNIKVAEAFQSMLPQDQPPEFRDIPISIDGQPGTATAAYNRRTGSFDIVPVTGGAGGGNLQEMLPAPLAPYAATFEAAGAKYGVDPKFLAAISMHETGGGMSSAFRNKSNAMGISDTSGPTAQASVEASIEKMARELAKPGGYYDGKNTVGEIGRTYAPIGAKNDPRGLNSSWVSGVGKYYAQLGGNPNGSVRITPGAVKSNASAKTPAELQKEQLEIQKLQGDVDTRKAEVAKQDDAAATAKASAEDTLVLIDKLKKHPGFNDLFGVTLVPDFIPATDKRGARAIKNQLGGQTFATIIQQMRGLGAMSDAEGKAMREAAARLDEGQSEKDVLDALNDLEKQIREKLGRLGGDSAPSNPASDYSSRLRSLK